MKTLFIATKAAAAVTIIALLSTETMGGIASDVHHAAFTPATTHAAEFASREARVDVGEVLYSANGERLGAIRAVGREDGQYTVIYLANATFLGDDVSVVNGRLQVRAIDADISVLADSEAGDDSVSARLDVLPR